MTKTQARKQLAKIKELVENLRIEVEETIDSIEPYENKDELTEAQEERLEWFEELQQTLEDFEYELDSKIDE
jgi:hypothetical protein